MSASMESQYFTKAACLIPMFTGTLSFISSALIIYIVLKSKVNTTYHRIMVFMSLWDMMTSFWFALSTTAMPKDTIYPFEGPKHGSFKLCAAQAFLVLLGMGISICSNACLAIYYLCTIRYNVNKETMTKRLEPLFVFLSLIISLVLPVLFASHNYLNPTPNEAFCAVGPYPFECDETVIPCERGKPLPPSTYKFMEIYGVSAIGIQFLTIVVSMFLIVHTFYLTERELNKNQATNDATNIRSMTRTIVRQALMYIFASLLTWCWTIMTFFVDTKPIVLGTAIFTPLQGFFNAIIFIYHKVENLQRIRGDDPSFYEALKAVLRKPNEVAEVHISGIAIISEETSDLRNTRAVLQLQQPMSSTEPLSTSASTPKCLTVSHSFPTEPSSDPSGVVSSTGIL